MTEQQGTKKKDPDTEMNQDEEEEDPGGGQVCPGQVALTDSSEKQQKLFYDDFFNAKIFVVCTCSRGVFESQNSWRNDDDDDDTGCCVMSCWD